MQRVQKQGSESENAQQTAQAKFTSKSRENEQANAIDDSPVMIAQRKKLQSLFGGAIQRVEDEEPLQGKFEAVQRVEEEEPLQGKLESVQRVEEEEPLQGKFNAIQRVEEDEPLQGKLVTAQRVEEEEPLQGKLETAQRVMEEAPLQGKFETVQRQAEVDRLYLRMQNMHGGGNAHGRRRNVPEDRRQRQEQQSRADIQQRLLQNPQWQNATPIQLKENNTGLPDHLKSGIESLSGMSMDNVKVHYNSSQPAQLNALAYAQGTDIHVAPGQEQHLPHEAWHVVQQAQGRVKPTMQMKEGLPVNDDAGLEHEADVMGAKAKNLGKSVSKAFSGGSENVRNVQGSISQRITDVVQKKDMHYWVVEQGGGGNKAYVGTFKSHPEANEWWKANKASYVGYTFGQGSSREKYR